MSSTARKAPTEPEAFIAWENRQRDRYELINGTVWAMTGGTLAHDRIAANVIGVLYRALQGSACAVHGSNLKVRSPNGSVMYPGALVRCGPADDEATEIDDPVLVAEVYSTRTRTYDMNGKRWAYYAIPSVRHILLIEPRRCVVELATRQDGNRWLSTLAQRLDERLDIPALGIEMGIGEIYAGTAVT